MEPLFTFGVSSSTASCGASRRRERPRTCSAGLAESGFDQLLVHFGRHLVQALVDRNFLGDHLLQVLGPQGREVEEQRLGGEVDLGARGRYFILVQIARIGLVDASAEFVVLPDRRANRD